MEQIDKPIVHRFTTTQSTAKTDTTLTLEFFRTQQQQGIGFDG
jgi:hypothetical protein